MPAVHGQRARAVRARVAGGQGVNALRQANEQALSRFLEGLAALPPEVAICRHDLDLRLCLAKRKDSPLKNAGRWYKFCNRCGRFCWLSRHLDIDHLLQTSEEFGTLIATRESLRRRTRAASALVAPLTPTPTHSRAITLVFWVENFSDPRFIGVPRTAGGAFRLSDHKLSLGVIEVEQVDRYEVFHRVTREWRPIPWETLIYPGPDHVLYLRRSGVTCQPRFIQLALAAWIRSQKSGIESGSVCWVPIFTYTLRFKQGFYAAKRASRLQRKKFNGADWVRRQVLPKYAHRFTRDDSNHGADAGDGASPSEGTSANKELPEKIGGKELNIRLLFFCWMLLNFSLSSLQFLYTSKSTRGSGIIVEGSLEVIQQLMANLSPLARLLSPLAVVTTVVAAAATLATLMMLVGATTTTVTTTTMTTTKTTLMAMTSKKKSPPSRCIRGFRGLVAEDYREEIMAKIHNGGPSLNVDRSSFFNKWNSTVTQIIEGMPQAKVDEYIAQAKLQQKHGKASPSKEETLRWQKYLTVSVCMAVYKLLGWKKKQYGDALVFLSTTVRRPSGKISTRRHVFSFFVFFKTLKISFNHARYLVSNIAENFSKEEEFNKAWDENCRECLKNLAEECLPHHDKDDVPLLSQTIGGKYFLRPFDLEKVTVGEMRAVLEQLISKLWGASGQTGDVPWLALKDSVSWAPLVSDHEFLQEFKDLNPSSMGPDKVLQLAAHFAANPTFALFKKPLSPIALHSASNVPVPELEILQHDSAHFGVPNFGGTAGHAEGPATAPNTNDDLEDGIEQLDSRIGHTSPLTREPQMPHCIRSDPTITPAILPSATGTPPNFQSSPDQCSNSPQLPTSALPTTFPPSSLKLPLRVAGNVAPEPLRAVENFTPEPLRSTLSTGPSVKVPSLAVPPPKTPHRKTPFRRTPYQKAPYQKPSSPKTPSPSSLERPSSSSRKTPSPQAPSLSSPKTPSPHVPSLPSLKEPSLKTPSPQVPSPPSLKTPSLQTPSLASSKKVPSPKTPEFATHSPESLSLKTHSPTAQLNIISLATTSIANSPRTPSPKSKLTTSPLNPSPLRHLLAVGVEPPIGQNIFSRDLSRSPLSPPTPLSPSLKPRSKPLRLPRTVEGSDQELSSSVEKAGTGIITPHSPSFFHSSQMLGITENRVSAPKEPITLESQDDPVSTEPFVPSIEPGALPVDSPISLPQKRKSLADGGGKKKRKLDLPPRAPSARLAANVSQPVERSTKKGTKASAVQALPEAAGIGFIAGTTFQLQVPEHNAAGSGTVFGPGLSGGAFQGTLAYDNWHTVRYSGSLNFEIVAGGVVPGGTVINFTLRGQSVATLTAVGVVLGGAVGVNGIFTWNN
ncbi:hypothetical protein NP233_g10757 [Leucocoprinus birnbaumii]|uniref:Uncharacterized protein n=1 Tax=Leucocoprinus birnbaumii TaxID=56174 RepID=A0AAD5VJS3_9AGAR|nr:hypothetical protein NP233_g10757 [Leucocoprinus birnbaumii]